MKLLRSSLATVAWLIGLALLATPVGAQTTLNSTTLSAALAANSQVVALASVTNITAGDIIVVVYANRATEAMQVNAVNTASVNVQRGVNGTAARAWASGATVYTGSRARFYGSGEMLGTCTSTNEQYLPHISLPGGNMYQCSTAGTWYRLDQQFTVNCRALLIADMVDQSCFIADRPYVVTQISEVHAVKEAGGTLTLIPRKQTTTQAPASGAALATALDMAAAATVQTVRNATLTTTVADLLVATGNRLGLDFTDDTAGELADVTVTFTLAPR